MALAEERKTEIGSARQNDVGEQAPPGIAPRLPPVADEADASALREPSRGPQGLGRRARACGLDPDQADPHRPASLEAGDERVR